MVPRADSFDGEPSLRQTQTHRGDHCSGVHWNDRPQVQHLALGAVLDERFCGSERSAHVCANCDQSHVGAMANGGSLAERNVILLDMNLRVGIKPAASTRPVLRYQPP